MPKETINDGKRHATEISPVTAPQVSPTSKPNADAGKGPQCHTRMALAVAAADSASTEPTDKSMPAMINTNVMPMDITNRAGISLAIATKVALLQK